MSVTRLIIEIKSIRKKGDKPYLKLSKKKEKLSAYAENQRYKPMDECERIFLLRRISLR